MGPFSGRTFCWLTPINCRTAWGNEALSFNDSMFFGRLECGHFAHPDFPTDYSNWNLCCEHRILHKLICMVLIFSLPDKKLNQQKQGLSLSFGVILYPKSDYSVSLSGKAASRPTPRCEKPEGRNLCFYKTSIAIAWGSFALLSECK